MAKTKKSKKKKHSTAPPVKNVKCEYCDLMFTTNWKMQRHANRSHLNIDKHYCPECPEIKDNIHDFFAHMRREHKLGHSCGVCSMTFPRQKMRAVHEKEVHNLVRSQPKSKKEEEKKPATAALPIPQPTAAPTNPPNPIPMLPPLPGMLFPFVPPISGFPPLPMPLPPLPGMPPFIPPIPYPVQPTAVAQSDPTASSFVPAKTLPTNETPFTGYGLPSSSSNYGQRTSTTNTVASSYNSTSKTRVSRFDQSAPASSHDKRADLYRKLDDPPPTFKPPSAVPYYPDRESASYPRSNTSSEPPSNPFEFERQEKLYAHKNKPLPSLSPPRSSHRYRPY